MTTLFIGATTQARSDWERFVCAPEAPDNYRPETAARYVANKLQQQAASAGNRPFSGYVSQIVILDETSELLRATTAPGDTSTASVAAMNFLVDHLPTSATYWPVSWFAFDARHLFPMLAVEAIRARAQVRWEVWWHRHFQQPHYADPYEMLVPSTVRADVDLAALCEYLGLSNYSLHDAASRAALVRDLVERAQVAK